jgi:archaellum component FlaC
MIRTDQIETANGDRTLRPAPDRSDMSELDDAIEEFLRKADAAYEEYDQGYADADATLRRLERHLEDLREAAEA